MMEYSIENILEIIYERSALSSVNFRETVYKRPNNGDSKNNFTSRNEKAEFRSQ